MASSSKSSTERLTPVVARWGAYVIFVGGVFLMLLGLVRMSPSAATYTRGVFYSTLGFLASLLGGSILSAAKREEGLAFGRPTLYQAVLFTAITAEVCMARRPFPYPRSTLMPVVLSVLLLLVIWCAYFMPQKSNDAPVHNENTQSDPEQPSQ